MMEIGRGNYGGSFTTGDRATVLVREVCPARSWLLELTAIWVGVASLAYAVYAL